jgi:hypothetical protein
MLDEQLSAIAPDLNRKYIRAVTSACDGPGRRQISPAIIGQFGNKGLSGTASRFHLQAVLDIQFKRIRNNRDMPDSYGVQLHAKKRIDFLQLCALDNGELIQQMTRLRIIGANPHNFWAQIKKPSSNRNRKEGF